MNKPGCFRRKVGSYKHFKAEDLTQPARVPCLHPTCKITFRTEHLRDMHIERFHQYLIGKEQAK